MRHEGMFLRGVNMETVKSVGKSGQISLGKSLAGQNYIVEELPGGDILLKKALVIPTNERWLDTPEMKAKIEMARKWFSSHPPSETDIDALEKAAR